MFRGPFRILIVIAISLFAAEYFTGSFGFDYRGGDLVNALFFGVAIWAVFVFVKPVLNLIAFPFGCLGHFVISFVLVLALIHNLATFLAGFEISDAQTLSFAFRDYSLPSVEAEGFASAALYSLSFCAVYSILDWITGGRG